ncbi:MAG: NUDIX hydrolase [Aristaeellaceae bacterium]
MPGGSVIPADHRLHMPHLSVSAVIRDGAGRLLLIRYVTGQAAWETPAGRVEPGESPEEAARRECLEKTGCATGESARLCVQCPADGGMDMTMHGYSGRAGGAWRGGSRRGRRESVVHAGAGGSPAERRRDHLRRQHDCAAVRAAL